MKIMENKHTAMQQLINEIVEHLTYDDDLSNDSRMTLETIRLRCLGKLSVEKQQMIDAYDKGEFNQGCNEDAEEYYNETYESNGSDAKDVTLGYKTSLDAQMLDKVEPKQETLEEAADIDSNRLFDLSINHYKDQSDYWAIGFDSFKRGAKWQAEKMYNEEEVYELLLKHQSAYRSVVRNTFPLDWSFDIKQWFEQYKNKKYEK
jgi:hypothetical protein